MEIFKKIKQEPTIFLFRKMWKFSTGRKHIVLLYITLIILATTATLFEPLIFSGFINEIQNNGITQANIIILILWLLANIFIGWLFWIFWAPARIIQNTHAFIVRLKYREHLLKGVLNLNLTWHSNKESGDTIDKINKSTDSMFDFAADDVNEIFYILVRIIGTTVALYSFDITIGIFSLIYTIVALSILLQFDKKLVPMYKDLNIYQNRIVAKVFDAMSNITSIIILGVKSKILSNIKKIMLAPFKLYKKRIVLNEIKWMTGDLLFHALIFIPIIFYIVKSLHVNTVVQIGTITAVYMYLSKLSDVFFTFAGQYGNMMKRKADIQNAEILEKDFIKSRSRKKKLSNWKKLDIQNLNFSYEDTTSEQHLNNINITINKGERIAFIGESGSGKTTFLKVLHGLYPTASATLTDHAKNSRTTSFADLDLKTMLVPQEPEIFSSTIKENMTLGINYSDREIRKVTKLAEFTNVIKQLPRGLDSMINEKGVNLSGGQKQRMALARALLFAQDKELILLDESTSSVDPENEVKIYQNIFTHFKDKTILASIHKMNLLKYFDRIIIFANGEVTDSGTFENLLNKNKDFKQNWKEYTKSHKM